MKLVLLAMIALAPIAGHTLEKGKPTKEKPTKELTKKAQVKQWLKKINPAYLVKPTQNNSIDAIEPITNKQVKGTYATQGFTNSLCNECSFPFSSAASIGKLVLRDNGTGVFQFVDLTVIFECESFTNQFYNIPVTYALNSSINGVGTLTLQDFPSTGCSITLDLVFKVRDGQIVGFNQLLNSGTQDTVNTPDSLNGIPLWFLGTGDKYSDDDSSSSNHD